LERLCPWIGDGVMAVRDVVQAAAGVGGGDNLYVEDVFSTYLYTGNGTSQTITNGIDLDGEGGLVWIKKRSAADNNVLVDTERPLTGSTGVLFSDLTTAQTGAAPDYFTSFNSNGFTVPFGARVNGSGATFASWTFRKSPKFFDVVTYTGNGGTQQNIAHNLEASPNLIIVKRTDATGSWYVAPMMLSNWNNDYLVLNSTAAKVSSSDIWQGTSGKSSTTFGVLDGSTVNISGATYVAYVFAHNAGGFGDDGEQNVISCGSFTTNGTGNATIDLGYEPQWVLVKNTGATEDWILVDNMRGWAVGGNSQYLRPNLTNAESGTALGSPTATGFNFSFSASVTYIYIAIRRGPMKTPESGTSVYNAIAYTGNDASNRQLTGLGFPPDLALVKARNQVRNYGWEDRLRGADKWLVSSGVDSEGSFSDYGAGGALLQNGITIGANGLTNEAPTTYIFQGMRRAPGFMDVVAYTGTGSATTQAHNLGVAPQLLIIKPRSASNNWWVLDVSSATARVLNLDLAFDAAGATYFGDNTVYVAPTSSVFSIGSNGGVNGSGVTYVAYLFASLPGVSKVGSYTGTGADLNVDCGFSAGARFILIKRTDSTGDWYVWDSVRGIAAGNDPYLLLNSTAAEITNTDYIDPLSSGFTVTSSAPAALNASGGSYIFLAIA
jgi:hypothetical protein